MKRTACFGALAALALVGACAGNDPGRPVPDGGMRCLNASMCDDGFACTVDNCGVGGTCEHMALDALCMAGETCVVGRGCTGSRPCTMSSECDDSIPCTSDSCAVGGMCAHVPVDALCTMPGQVCNVMTGCGTPAGCSSAAECNDTFACTVDGCNAARMCTHTPIDAMCMTGERCVVGTGCMMMRPCTTDDDCQDTSFCNGREVCTTEFGCDVAPMPRNCADTDACTVDSCDATANMCIHTCDPSMPACGCTPTPDCNGTFDLTPTAMYACGIAGFDIVTISLSSVDIVCDMRAWSATPHSITTMSGAVSLGQVPAPVGPDFDLASSPIPGGCTEQYRLQGRFTDTNTLTATFTATFTGSECFECTGYSVMVTGRRR